MRIAIIGNCHHGRVGVVIKEHLCRHQLEENIPLVRSLISTCSVVEGVNFEYEKKFKHWQYGNLFLGNESILHSRLSRLSIGTFRDLHAANKLIEEKKSTLSQIDRERIHSLYLKITTK